MLQTLVALAATDGNAPVLSLLLQMFRPAGWLVCVCGGGWWLGGVCGGWGGGGFSTHDQYTHIYVLYVRV